MFLLFFEIAGQTNILIGQTPWLATDDVTDRQPNY
jgi:hypothetical protein